jgi:hypothetical protein
MITHSSVHLMRVGLLLTNVIAPQPKIKEIQISLNGFLGEKGSPVFCKELWNLMLSAQESPVGVPKEMLEAKKAELTQKVRDYQHEVEIE